MMAMTGSIGQRHVRVTLALSIRIWFLGCSDRVPERLMEEDFPPSAEQGRALVAVYACTACHEIGGLSGIPGNLGPPLTQWSQRKIIAGRIPNEPRLLAHWLRNPQEVKPGTAMPDLGISELEALSMAAYLYSQ